ncbi:MAG: ASCH domain-containing protein [Treponema sp.]|nr:ASCH domain-containing protein [Treponema sp.]
MTELDEYWQKFLSDTGRSPDERCSGDLFFEAKGFVGNELLSLVLAGKKTAFFTSYATFAIDGEPLPVSGELYIVVDKNNQPQCVIEFANIQVLPYNEITWEMAKLEGEDENLEAWREKQREYLEDEGAVLGFDFTPDIRLVFQNFRVIYK